MKITHVQLNAAAKINLTLGITGVRNDGYHEIESVMQTVSLYDKIEISATDSKNIELSVNLPFIPCDNRNTCYKAAWLYFEACKTEIQGVRIHIEKKIPSCAGLGGGSADAAAVLRGLEYIYGKCPEDIYEIAAKVGADVPFCLAGGTKICRGIGEIMTPVTPKPSLMRKIHLVIAKNTRGLSTPYIFSKYDSFDSCRLVCPDSEQLCQAMSSGNISLFTSNIANTLQSIAEQERPEISQLIDDIKAQGALTAAMTGSGAAVFGIFDDFSLAKQCVNYLRKKAVFAEYAKFITPNR